MNKFFDPDGLFARIMNVILALMLLNAMWMVCSMPIITMGASNAALYSVLFKMRDGDETKVIRRFIAAFKENFKTATAAWLVILVAAVICGLDLYFARQMDSDVASVIAGVGLVLVAMAVTFTFPLIARYENTWRNHLKNGMLLALSHVPRVLLAWLLWGGTVFLTLYSVDTMYIMILMWLMAGFSCLSFANISIFTPIFRKLEPEKEEKPQEELEA